MATSSDDAASRLWWALKRYALLSLGIVVACTALAYGLAPRDDAPVYRAAALVIASQLETLRPEQLPRMAEAIFTGGRVAEVAVDAGELGIPPTQLIPEHADLEPIAGTVLLRVVGYATDPERAALIANSAAEALTAELNRAGPGVGQFVIQEPSRPPSEPEPGTAVPPALIGVLAGLLLSFGVVGLVMVLRRPVLAGDEAASTAEAPLLGAIRLPRHSRPVDPTEVIGLSAVIRQLYPQRHGVAVFVSPRGNQGARARVAEIIARGLGRSGTVCFVPGTGKSAAQASKRLEAHDEVVVSAELALGAALIDMPVVVDGPSTDELDVPQFLPPDTRSVLVVAEGAPRRGVESAARQFLPGELTGVIFVPFGRRRRRGSGGGRPLPALNQEAVGPADVP